MKKIMVFIVIVFSMFHGQDAFAGELDYFDIEFLSESAKVGEALDLKITAMDADGNIVDDFVGDVTLYSETDFDAEFLDGDYAYDYSFSLEDNGSVILEDVVTFSSSGMQDIHIYDITNHSDATPDIAEIEVTWVAGELDHYDLEFSSGSTKMGEAVDLTITAMDVDGNVVDDYTGTVLVFSETDPKATLSSEFNENSYTFSLADKGSVKFENGVTFFSEGDQEIRVYDLNDETDSNFGATTVEVEGESVGDDSAEEVQKEKVREMIISSFRKVRKPHTILKKTSIIEEDDSAAEVQKEKIREMIISSFRKVRKPHTIIKQSSGIEEDDTEEEVQKEKVRKMIISSFRKVRKPHTIIKQSSEIEEDDTEEEVQKKIIETITSSFRKTLKK